MVRQLILIGSLLAAVAVHAAPAEPAHPMVTEAPDANLIEKRATTCTFSGSEGASKASKSKTSCSTIYLSDVAVPSGTTLDLTDLNDGTHVRSRLSYTLFFYPSPSRAPADRCTR